ncbi:hypothetical protein WBJ53_19315 [Spirosoma sp. SC4-14]
MKSVFLLMIGLLVCQQRARAQQIGIWGLSAKGLLAYQWPLFCYFKLKEL